MADKLANMGFLPFVPLHSHFWHFLSPHPYEFWTTMDLEWVLRCDCILRMEGESSGADNEIKYAEEHGIPVFYSLDDLLIWAKEPQ
jgi:hypothetical protein